MSMRNHMAPGSILTPLCIWDESAHLVVRSAAYPGVPRSALFSRPSTGIALIRLSINEDESSNEIDRWWNHCTQSPQGCKKNHTHATIPWKGNALGCTSTENSWKTQTHTGCALPQTSLAFIKSIGTSTSQLCTVIQIHSLQPVFFLGHQNSISYLRVVAGSQEE